MYGGRNNRVFCVIANDSKFLLKSYLEHPNDKRDRLKAEFDFCKYAWGLGLPVAKPYAKDNTNKLALYDFIEGRKILKEEIDIGLINQALDFFIGLNKVKPLEGTFSVASEACFSIDDHINIVQRRIERLKNVEPSSDINKQMIHFIKNDLLELWNKIKCIESGDLKIERCISPSDFGFHNAILKSNAKLYFFDFEYAGWDDAAKMICDFFCQPDMPIPLKYFDFFTKRALSIFAEPGKHIKRVKLLLPVYKIKMCCIMLNEFLDEGEERRKFSLVSKDHEKLKLIQLNRVKKYLKNIDDYLRISGNFELVHKS
jgi:hypothetical protein